MITIVCLACLSENDLNDVFKLSNQLKNTSAASMLKHCFDIDVYPNTRINKICVNCIELLNTAYKFKKQIVNTMCHLENSFATKTIHTINIELFDKIIELNSINNESMKINTINNPIELINDKNHINEGKNVKTIEETQINKQNYIEEDTKSDKFETNDIIEDTIKIKDCYNTILDNITEIKERNFMINDTNVTSKGNDLVKDIELSNTFIDDVKKSNDITEDTTNDKGRECYNVQIGDTVIGLKESNYILHDTKQRNNMMDDNKNDINNIVEDTITYTKATNHVKNYTEQRNNMIDDRISDTDMLIDRNESTDRNNLSLFVDKSVDVGLNRVVVDSTEIDGVEEIFYCDYEESLENTLTIDNTPDSYLIQHKEDNNVDIKIILDGDMYEEKTGNIYATRGEGDGGKTTPKRLRQSYPPKKPYTLAEGQTKCDICQTECHKQKNLHTHMNIHYPMYSCHICDKKYASKERLTVHLRAHLDGKFRCKYCEKIFSNYNSCHSHMWRAHNSRSRFSCALCDAKFAKLSEKHAHMKTAHGLTDNAYVCEECGKKYYSSDARSTHVRRVHRKVLKKFRCAFCDQTFLQINTLQSHTEKKHKDVGL